MGAVRRYSKALFKRGFQIIGSYFAWMRKYARNPKKYPFLVRQNKIKNLSYKTMLDMNADIIVEGLDQIPADRACAIYANHLSMADPLTFVSILPYPSSYLSKKENENMPFIGKIMKGLEGMFMDREDLKQSLKVMMKIEEDLKANNKNWVIFPDGTRNKDPLMNVGEFHHGSFRPAMKAGVPIIPVAFYGTKSFFRSKPVFKKYPIYMKVLKPIMPEEYEGKTTNEIAKKVHDMIQSAVAFDLRPRYHKYMSQYKGYRFNSI